MNDKKSKWDEIRETGILVFILSLPIMIWKSGHFGRFITCLIMGLLVLFLVGRTSDVIFNKFINRWEIRNESNRTLADIHKTKENINNLGGFLSGLDSFYRAEAERKSQEMAEQYRDKFLHLEDKVTEIESNISVIKDAEQAGIKQRIIELREAVLLNKKSIDSVEIRSQFEKIFKNMKILSEEDKERFMHDLKEMGFYLEQEEGRINAYHNGSMIATSGDTVMVMPFSGAYASVDSTMVYSSAFRRRQQ